MSYGSMTGWVLLIYVGVSLLFWYHSDYLDSSHRVAWALFWPILSLVLAVLLTVSLVRRARR